MCFEHRYLKSGIYNISVTATDIYGLTGTKIHSANITNDGAVLVFRPGWNAFSTPVNNDSTVSELFGGFSWYYAVYKWDETSQSWTALGPIDKLDPTRGYFVHGPISGTAEIELTGTAATFDDSWMWSGWNLVGTGFYPVEQPYDKWAYWWDGGTNAYIPTHNMEPEKGYFIKKI